MTFGKQQQTIRIERSHCIFRFYIDTDRTEIVSPNSTGIHFVVFDNKQQIHVVGNNNKDATERFHVSKTFSIVKICLFTRDNDVIRFYPLLPLLFVPLQVFPLTTITKKTLNKSKYLLTILCVRVCLCTCACACVRTCV